MDFWVGKSHRQFISQNDYYFHGNDPTQSSTCPARTIQLETLDYAGLIVGEEYTYQALFVDPSPEVVLERAADWRFFSKMGHQRYLLRSETFKRLVNDSPHNQASVFGTLGGAVALLWSIGSMPHSPSPPSAPICLAFTQSLHTLY